LLARGTAAAWQSASLYHLAHSVAALALLAWADVAPARAARLLQVIALWLGGCLAFSGSIYVLALGGPRWLGPITPLGGLLFMLGWALLVREGPVRDSR
jgi:uncharacterized membrane protein YgdD (TMEM256/DUF423 family)